MTTYTIEVQRGHADETYGWTAVHSETFDLSEPGWTKEKIATFAALDVAEGKLARGKVGKHWRVVVWAGKRPPSHRFSGDEFKDLR